MIHFIEGWEGFSGQDTTANAAQMLQKYPASSATGNIKVVAGNGSPNAISAGVSGTAGNFRIPFPQAGDDTYWFGVDFKMTSVSAQVGNWLLYQGADIQMFIAVLNDGSVQIRRGPSGTLQTSATGIVTADNWYRLECRYHIHGSTGTWDVWLNGTLLLSGSGNTLHTSAAITHFAMQFQAVATSTIGNMWMDNVYLAYEPHTRLEAWRILGSKPAGVGDDTEWTPSGMADNYTMVNEGTPDGDTTHVEASNARDLYEYDTIDDNKDVIFVQMDNYAKQEGAKRLRAAVKIGSTVHVQTPGETPGLTYGVVTAKMPLSPATDDPWTMDEINDAQFGMQVDE